VKTLKQWTVLAVVAALALVGGGWFLLISPERSEAATLHEQVDLQRSVNDQKRTALTVLRDKAEALPEQERDLAEVARKIPSEPALPALVRR
jgi:Tfp pilus assembly protein PilO